MRVQHWFAPVVARLRTANPYAVDSALAALVLFAVSLQWLFPDEGGDPLSWQGWLLGAGTAVPLVWRRAAPFATAWVVSAATPAMAVYHSPPPDVMYGGLVVLYTVAARCLPWQRRLMLAGWPAGVSVVMQHKEHAQPFEYAFHLLSVLCAYGLGSLARVQRAYTAALEDRARRLERERAADNARATAQERARIARDMHDILAHAVSLMVVQAEAGPVVVRSDPERAEAAFEAIAGAGRDAMARLRRILGVLKEERRDGSSGHRPQPGIAALPGLVRQVGESAGLRVGLRTGGQPRPLLPDTEVAVYRVVREALTNTVKHAHASATAVELDWTEDELVLTVTDGAPRGPRAGTGRSDCGSGRRPAGARRRPAAVPTAASGSSYGCPSPPTGRRPWGEHPGGGGRRPGAGAQRLQHDPGGAAGHRGGRGGRGRCRGGRRGAPARARRAAAGQPYAGDGRPGGGPSGVRAVRLPGGHADHVRPGRVRVRGAVRGRRRLPPQGRPA